ncbi:RimK family alpha-L-glutamate ligase [Aerosakkonemataceae cyanobacterium BLCC-F154]|uniref:RimK family alpha-L-glutamate ligase n=1 Tax=Floridaenema fluviatile BLCC-F154 TaxID=3153640 RepID=A0ABV4Y561_9CYAN
MNILILGDGSDAHAAHLKNALTKAGAAVDYLNTYQFPTQLRLTWRPDTQVGYLTLPGGRQLNLQDIHSVFWRNFSGVYIPSLKDSHQQQVAFNDAMSTLRSLIQACPARWINSWQAYQFHKEKPLQLSQVKQIGVTIPATLISNNPDRITEFTEAHEKVIFKPVYGGAHTQFVTKKHLNPQRLSQVLSLSPVTIQEYIPGTNIRTYVIADCVYSAEIRSRSLDFREDFTAELIPIELPESIGKQSLAITKALLLEWTAIDWRIKPTGEFVFLEANPSPMFIHFERKTGFPITEKLVNLLLNS